MNEHAGDKVCTPGVYTYGEQKSWTCLMLIRGRFTTNKPKQSPGYRGV